tara:strand:- start:5872 stop:6111 length:240 start_codon:yes stop_codon:yes gene_type:complete
LSQKKFININLGAGFGWLPPFQRRTLMEKTIHKDNYKSFRTEIGLKEEDPKTKKANMEKILNGEMTGEEVVASGYDTHE